MITSLTTKHVLRDRQISMPIVSILPLNERGLENGIVSVEEICPSLLSILVVCSFQVDVHSGEHTVGPETVRRQRLQVEEENILRSPWANDGLLAFRFLNIEDRKTYCPF